MSKELEHIYDDEISFESDETSEETVKITREDYMYYQIEEIDELKSNLYDFFKNYMDKKSYSFPILDHFNYRSVFSIVNKFTTPIPY